jgi:hypothetical protein
MARTEWTLDLVRRVERLIAQGVEGSALAERYGHRDSLTFRASFRRARLRLTTPQAEPRRDMQRAARG